VAGGAGPGAGGPGGGGPGGGGGRSAMLALLSSPYGVPPSDLQNKVQAALDDLNTALADPTAVPDSIKTKMDAYRDLKLQADEALAKDSAALKQVLTTKQEATLLSMGLVN
jgi:hypothetical protein